MSLLRVDPSVRTTLAAAIGLAAACSSGCSADEPPPNVLLIVWDTVRADRVDCYGADAATTPWLDRFAAESRVFERAYSPSVWTLPSHASLFTGLPEHAHGVNSANKWLGDEHDTLAERLAGAGYATYAFSANTFVSSQTNLTAGFERVEYAFHGRWKEEGRRATRAKLDPRDRSSEISPGRELEDGERERPGPLYKDSAPVAQRALLEWLDGPRGDRPFFAYLNYMECHTPRVPTMQSRVATSADWLEIEHGLNVDQTDVRALRHVFGREPYSEEDLQAIRAVYDASLRDLDRATGELMDELGRRGLLENTVVILTSDHGDNLGEHGLFGHRFCVYDTLARVPLVLHHPRLVEAGRDARPVSTLDVYATVLELAGLATDRDAGSSIDLLSGERSEAGPVFTELLVVPPKSLAVAGLSEEERAPWLRAITAVVKDGMKLVAYSDGERELYDLESDPEELHDLAADEPLLVLELERELEAWRAGAQPVPAPIRGVAALRPAFSDETRRALQMLGYAGD